MTYKEAKKYKAGDRIGFHGEQMTVVATRNDKTSKPPVVIITAKSKILGQITMPHKQFQAPIIYQGTWNTFEETIN